MDQEATKIVVEAPSEGGLDAEEDVEVESVNDQDTTVRDGTH